MNTTFMNTTLFGYVHNNGNGNNFKGHRKNGVFSRVLRSIETDVSRNKGPFGVQRYTIGPVKLRD